MRRERLDLDNIIRLSIERYFIQFLEYSNWLSSVLIRFYCHFTVIFSPVRIESEIENEKRKKLRTFFTDHLAKQPEHRFHITFFLSFNYNSIEYKIDCILWLLLCETMKLKQGIISNIRIALVLTRRVKFHCVCQLCLLGMRLFVWRNLRIVQMIHFENSEPVYFKWHLGPILSTLDDIIKVKYFSFLFLLSIQSLWQSNGQLFETRCFIFVLLNWKEKP